MTLSTVLVFRDFINYLKPFIVNRLQTFIKSTDLQAITTSLNADLEYQYHFNGNQNLNELSTLIFNDYACKLLSIRTLDNIFNTVLEEDLLDNTNLLEQLSSIGNNTTLLQLIKHIIFNSEEVSNVMTPYFNELEQVVNTALEFINSQKYIEQKTAEWFAVRSNMISASMCGFLDGKRCGTGITNESAKIMEKSGMKDSGFCGWLREATRHGQQFEDLTGDIYDTVNNITSREYGILTDEKHSHIGASPDGIIIKVNSDNFYSKLKYGRMREIKNPKSRTINNKIPKYYYYQMQQQMYVCKLPFCDFIQTDFKYPNTCSIEQFSADTMTQEKLLACKTWNDLTNLITPYLLENLNYDVIMNDFTDSLLNEPISNINNVLLSLFINNWDAISYFPLCNINKRGQLKGIIWSFVRYNTSTDVDFKMEWLPITKQYIDIIPNINNYLQDLKDKYIEDGYMLEDTLYWSCGNYSVIEVEYNKVMYENEVIPIIHEKWDLIKQLKAISNEKERDALYLKHYPNCKKTNEKQTKLTKKPKFSLLNYA